jgi:hypothetical protein
MRMRKTLFLAGVFVLLTAGLTLADGEAVHFNVSLDNLGTPSEPGTGVAIVTLAEGNAKVEMQGLQSLPHDSATGQRIRGYAGPGSSIQRMRYPSSTWASFIRLPCHKGHRSPSSTITAPLTASWA